MKKASIKLAYILRHNPKSKNIEVDQYGWANVKELCEKMPIDINTLKKIVETDRKGRYSFSEDGISIRANQGHSINVNVGLKQATPPDILYHGTGNQFIPSIMKHGICSKSRLHVHLSDEYETAVIVGKRHGDPVVLSLDVKQMIDDGVVFYISENKIWLTDFVDRKYLTVI